MIQNKIAELPSVKQQQKVTVTVGDPEPIASAFSGTSSLRRQASRRQSISNISKFFRRDSSTNLVSQPAPIPQVSVSPQPNGHPVTPTGALGSTNSAELNQPETPRGGNLVHSKSMIFFHSSTALNQTPNETVWEQAKKTHSTVPKPMFHWMRKQVIIIWLIKSA